MKLPPKGATHFRDGLYYKIGVHGYAFYWVGDDRGWLKASIPASALTPQCSLEALNSAAPERRGPGRPKGSRNKPKVSLHAG